VLFRSYQLWLQLPPELEESEVEYQNFQPEAIPVKDGVKIIVGEYNGMKSPLKTPFELTYLDIHLAVGEKFYFESPAKQTTGFIFLRQGEVELHGDSVLTNSLAILETNAGEISIASQSDSKFVLLLSQPSNHSIVTYGGSIHTNHESLNRSLANIQKIQSVVI